MSRDLAERLLPKCISGETILGLAMTEPSAGSDLAGIKSRAARDGDAVDAGVAEHVDARLGVEEVAARCGFGTAETMRRRFQQSLGHRRSHLARPADSDPHQCAPVWCGSRGPGCRAAGAVRG